MELIYSYSVVKEGFFTQYIEREVFHNKILSFSCWKLY